MTAFQPAETFVHSAKWSQVRLWQILLQKSVETGLEAYEFHLGDAVPEDHLVRKIDAALDLSWLRSELAPRYSSVGRPSIDPELMIRMLVVGYVFAIRSERSICREVQVNLA